MRGHPEDISVSFLSSDSHCSHINVRYEHITMCVDIIHCTIYFYVLMYCLLKNKKCIYLTYLLLKHNGYIHARDGSIATEHTRALHVSTGLSTGSYTTRSQSAPLAHKNLRISDGLQKLSN